MITPVQMQQYDYERHQTALLGLFTRAEESLSQQILTRATQRKKIRWLMERRNRTFDIIGGLNKGVDKWFDREVLDAYTAGREMSINLWRSNQKKLPKVAFSDVHRRAVDAIVHEATLGIKEATTHIGSRVSRIARVLQYELGSRSLILGWSHRELEKEFRQRMVDAGLTGPEGLRVRVGRWRGTAKSYAKMVARTVLAKASRTGTNDWLLDAGMDLVQVTGPTGCRICNPWIGVVLSLTGDTRGYPTVAGAEGAGLGHPNCVHDYAPWVDEFASTAQKSQAKELTLAATGA